MVILTERSLTGRQSTRDIVKYDIIHHLIMQNWTRDELIKLLDIDQLPNFGIQDFDSVLNEVATPVPNLNNNNNSTTGGHYSLKTEYYSFYNKYYFDYRFPQRSREVRLALINQRRIKFVIQVPPGTLAPLRPEFKQIAQLLLSPHLYKIIFYSLFHCLSSMDPQGHAGPDDDKQQYVYQYYTLDNILHLLMMAVNANLTPPALESFRRMCNPNIVDMLDKIMTTDHLFLHPTVSLILIRVSTKRAPASTIGSGQGQGNRTNSKMAEYNCRNSRGSR
ncbi:hypothetical protein SAMD00019534_006340 [Acytostelium subglobosum LB1]|uniref:hypothetical protein n=1 Tax=Acytostelium subglobosum LB1 TaxID=1410327 RepID=UPI000644B406|nr:hypothetical protein SAMD00019534_006340 [Acytostelium subglobosum LB1]GAM17459.1 hypothetical protein SAMD00019534_006340 [Acytostelium subglobosum LB1]|eukprot:XP_012759521.1 hypothetical protein SAMD00019534_006340 [Acytostelium subglobosum LB1]